MKKNLSKLIIIITILSFVTIASADTTAITNYVGTGDMGYKEGKTMEANLNQPYGLAMDTDGGLIIADSYNNRIRKVKDGNVITLAGFSDKVGTNGFPAGGAADGEALKAKFNHPRGVAVDSKGSIFVSDTGNNMIRKISGGKVVTFSGSNKGAGYADGTGSKVQFNTPSGMAIDMDDNIYVADTLNHVIRKITSKGVVTTYTGKNAAIGGFKDGPIADALFNEPSDVKIDKNGIIYVLDCGNQLVRKIENDQVTTYAGVRESVAADTGYAAGGFLDGQSSKAKFNFPKAMDIAEDGTIFIADTWNHRIRAIQANGSVTTVAGTGVPGKKDDPLPQTMFNGPMGMLYNSGALYISDTWNQCVRAMKIDLKKISNTMDRSELIKGIKFVAKNKNIQVWMDKKNVVFNNEKPYSDKSKTYLPLRTVFEKWGAKVNYLRNGQVEIIKGSFYKILTPKIDPIFMKNKRMMIDTKTFAEITGFRVEIIPEYNAVVIST